MNKVAQSERRKYVRLAEDGQMSHRFCTSSESSREKTESSLINLSAGGALFDAEKSFSLGDILRLKIDLPGWERFKANGLNPESSKQSPPVEVLASVVRCEHVQHNGHFEIGVSFVGIDEDHQWAIVKYIFDKVDD